MMTHGGGEIKGTSSEVARLCQSPLRISNYNYLRTLYNGG